MIYPHLTNMKPNLNIPGFLLHLHRHSSFHLLTTPPLSLQQLHLVPENRKNQVRKRVSKHTL